MNLYSTLNVVYRVAGSFLIIAHLPELGVNTQQAYIITSVAVILDGIEVPLADFVSYACAAGRIPAMELTPSLYRCFLWSHPAEALWTVSLYAVTATVKTQRGCDENRE